MPKAVQKSAWVPRRPGVPLVALLISIPFAPVWAQIPRPSTAPAPAQPEAPKDSLGRTTPRGSVLGFLNAAHKGEDALAVQYLNTRLRGQDAYQLVRQLFVVLDRRLPAKLQQISDRPEGSLPDPLK